MGMVNDLIQVTHERMESRLREAYAHIKEVVCSFRLYNDKNGSDKFYFVAMCITDNAYEVYCWYGKNSPSVGGSFGTIFTTTIFKNAIKDLEKKVKAKTRNTKSASYDIVDWKNSTFKFAKPFNDIWSTVFDLENVYNSKLAQPTGDDRLWNFRIILDVNKFLNNTEVYRTSMLMDKHCAIVTGKKYGTLSISKDPSPAGSKSHTISILLNMVDLYNKDLSNLYGHIMQPQVSNLLNEKVDFTNIIIDKYLPYQGVNEYVVLINDNKSIVTILDAVTINGMPVIESMPFVMRISNCVKISELLNMKGTMMLNALYKHPVFTVQSASVIDVTNQANPLYTMNHDEQLLYVVSKDYTKYNVDLKGYPLLIGRESNVI